MTNIALAIAALVVVLTYAYFFWIAGTSVRQIESADDYFVAGRKLRTGSFFATLYAAEMSIATVFIAFFDLASFLGLQLLTAVFTFSIGQLVLSRLAPRIKQANSSRLTLPGVLGQQYQSDTFRLIALVTITIGFGGLFATEILVGAQLLKPLFEAEAYVVVLLLMASLVTFYTALGGFRNVVRTDRYQTAFVVIGIVALVVAALNVSSTPIEALSVSADRGIVPSVSLIVNLLVINVAYPLVDLAAWQRIAAASDEQTAKRGGGLGAGAFFVCWITILLSAIVLVSATNKGGADAILSSFLITASFSWWHGLVAGVGLGALLAALLSAGDIFLITATQAICMDATRHKYFSTPTDLSDRSCDTEVLVHARKVTFLVALISLIVVGWLLSIGARASDLVFVLYGSTTALLPAVLLVLFFPERDLKSSSLPAVASSVVGICMGWAYGVLALIGSDTTKGWLSLVDPVPGPASTFNAACVSLAWSICTFVVVTLFARLRKTGG